MKKQVDNYVRCGFRSAWIMFDLENGHSCGKNDSGKGYIWIFSTRKEALKHRKNQHDNPSYVKLSYPIHVKMNRNYYPEYEN